MPTDPYAGAQRLKSLAEAYRADSAGEDALARWNEFLDEFVLRAQVVVLARDDQPGYALAAVAGGGHAVAAYTDRSYFEANFPDLPAGQHAAVVSFDDLAAFLAGAPAVAGIFLDPPGAALLLSRDTVGDVAATKRARMRADETLQVPAGARVVVGEPAAVPDGLLDAIRRAAASERSVKRLWLRQAIIAGPAGLLLVVDADDVAACAPLLGAAARPYLEPGRGFDIVAAGDRALTAGAKPIYRRTAFGR